MGVMGTQIVNRSLGRLLLALAMGVLPLGAAALEEQRINIKTLGGPFTSGANVPAEIPATLRIPAGDKVPAVVIVHGSAGIDGRGAFHSQALNEAGIATLEIDMWTPRRVVNLQTRPKTSLDTLPDVYGALAFLNQHPRIQAGQVGIMGFSWGGVMSLLPAFGAMPVGVPASPELRFKAHAPFYPGCEHWLPGGRAERLISMANPTGAPVMLHNGTRDDYDSQPDICTRLVAAHPKLPLEVVMVPDATHGFDRERDVPSFFDPLAKGAKGAYITMKANREAGLQARERVVNFFKRHLMGGV